MKMRLFQTAAAIGLAAILGVTNVKAEDQDVILTNNYDEAGTFEPDVVPSAFADDVMQPEAAPPCGGCGSCNQCSPSPCNHCGCCDQCCGDRRLLRRDWLGLQSRGRPFADPCPNYGLYVWSGFDSFRGPSENVLSGNNGGSGGANIGLPLGQTLGDLGIAGQFGASEGVYDWNGRVNVLGGNQAAQSQTFFTYGIFRRADADRPVSWGVVQDWMVNQNWGVFTVGNSLSQWRGQIAYAVNDRAEFGINGMLRDKGASTTIAVPGAAPITTSYRVVNQVNVFYHRKIVRCGGDMWFYFGVPEAYRINRAAGGSLGSTIFGQNFLIPVSDRAAVYCNWNYMNPSQSSSTPQGAADEVWNLSFGMAFYPGQTARSTTVAGRKFMPLLPVANNGTMFIDSNF